MLVVRGVVLFELFNWNGVANEHLRAKLTEVLPHALAPVLGVSKKTTSESGMGQNLGQVLGQDLG